MAVVILNLREFALCYSRHPGDMRVRSRVRLAVADTTSAHPVETEFPILRCDSGGPNSSPSTPQTLPRAVSLWRSFERAQGRSGRVRLAVADT